MNVSTLLKAGSLSWVLVTSWTGPLQATPDCVSTLRIDAPAAVRATMLARLQSGRLAEVSADHCQKAAVRLAQKGSRWELQFTQGATSIVRDVKSPEMAAVWVESWLVPATTLDAPASQSLDATGASNNTTDTTAAYASTAPMGIEASAAWYGAAGSSWLGPGFRYHGHIAGNWWVEPHLGLGYAVTRRPTEGSRTMHVGTAFGRDILRTASWFPRPAADLGFVSLLWHDRTNEVRMSGPMLGAEFTVGYSLARSVWLVGRVSASLLFADRTETSRMRVCTDDRCNDTDRMDVVTSARYLDSTWVGGLRLGLLIHLGDLT